MSKQCLIYETLNGVKDLNVKRDGELMTLSGVFGVCGVRNNNKRVYEASNYSKMVTEMQARIKAEGGIPGELEHPQQMNITLENVSHKITDINIDKNGVVTGSITLLNTPKGKIAQAIVEGGLPLFISSRATGNIDKSGNVCLERIATYDLVGTPGFSQAKLHLNENQIVESLSDSIYCIVEDESQEMNENIDNIDDMDLQEIQEALEELQQRVDDLEEANRELEKDNARLRSMRRQANESIDTAALADAVQEWIVEEYSPVIERWIAEEYGEHAKDEIAESVEEWVKEEYAPEFADNVEKWIKEEYTPELADNVEQWIKEEYTPELADNVEQWITEEYSPVVEGWCKNEFAKGIQDWIVEEYSPEVENWLNENKADNLDAIDETLKLLESIEPSKPIYESKAVVGAAIGEPKFIQEMPAEKRVKWDMASNEVKESIYRRAKLYNFVNESAIERFWENINFEEVKPAKSIYEGLENIEDSREMKIRQDFRRWRNR